MISKYVKTRGGSIDFSSIAASLIPAADNTYDVGENSTPLRWRNIYSRNLDVQVASAANVGARVRGAIGQSGNLFEFQDSGSNVLSSFDANGALELFEQGTNSRQAMLNAFNTTAHCNGTNSILRFQIGIASTVASGNMSAIEGTLTASHTSNTLSSLSGVSTSLSLNHSGTGDVTTATVFNGSADMSTSRTVNNVAVYQAQWSSGSAAGSVGSYRSFSSFILVGNETLDVATHFLISGANIFGAGGIGFHYGIWLSTAIAGGSARNRAIILNDDGVGAEIAFGAGIGGDASIYYDGSDLIVDPDINTTGSGSVSLGRTRIGGYLERVGANVTSTSYTAADESLITVDDDTAGSTVTISLPAAASASGRVYEIKKLGTTANVVIDPNSTETIDGGTTATLTTQYEAISLWSDGSNWLII